MRTGTSSAFQQWNRNSAMHVSAIAANCTGVAGTRPLVAALTP
jgi:hypothetical protein